jgi:hypothetical protein
MRRVIESSGMKPVFWILKTTAGIGNKKKAHMMCLKNTIS